MQTGRWFFVAAVVALVVISVGGSVAGSMPTQGTVVTFYDDNGWVDCVHDDPLVPHH